MNYSIDIIIVTYNSSKVIFNCINSIKNNLNFLPSIFVIDNLSTDKTVKIIKSNFSFVNLIINESNIGFGAAINKAIPLCESEYIFFLNPDTEIYQKTIPNIINYMKSNPSIGLAGTRVIRPDGSVQSTISYHYPGQRHAKQEKYIFNSLKGKIAWVNGSSMVARTHAIKSISGFDEDFFLYAEEIDLCFRLKKSGWQIGYIENSPVLHLKGHSEVNTDLYNYWLKKLNGRFTFYKKHYSKATLQKLIFLYRMQAYFRLFILLLTFKTKSTKSKIARYKAVLKVITFSSKY